jgi:hypothetical protein
MQDGPRVLVAAALGKIIEPLLRQSLSDATVRIAEDKAAVKRAVGDCLRFDVVVSDLTWNDYVIEYSFDGLDVLGHPAELGPSDACDLRRPGPRSGTRSPGRGSGATRSGGYLPKGDGASAIDRSRRYRGSGGKLTEPQFSAAGSPPGIPRIHTYFGKGKGSTAARLAGAIASGRAVNHETLASTAHVGYDTAAKLVDYLGPLIRDRGEHSPELKMTPEVVYRWSGEHARCVLSWCRRNGHGDIATRVTAAHQP